MRKDLCWLFAAGFVWGIFVCLMRNGGIFCGAVETVVTTTTAAAANGKIGERLIIIAIIYILLNAPIRYRI